MRWRTAVAGFTILLFLAVYVVAAVTVATSWLPPHWLAQMLFYPVAGLAWIVPVRWLLLWAGTDPAAD